MHIKREIIPKSWPIPRKGTTYVVAPLGGFESSIPLLIVLRDILHLAKNRREARKILREGGALLNLKKVYNERQGVSLFDTLSFPLVDKHYRIMINILGKFSADEISEKDAGKKVAKVINKILLKGKKLQINLSDGRNYLTSLSCSTHDSVLINLKSRRIEGCIPLKEGARALVIGGKHSGAEGNITRIHHEKREAEISTERKTFPIPFSKIIVVP